MKTQRIREVVMDALNPDYSRPERRNKKGLVVEEGLQGGLWKTTPEILEFVNKRTRHGSTPAQIGNVMSKIVLPVVVKIADDVPRAGILSGSYGVAAWAKVEHLADAIESLYGGPDNAWTHVSTVSDFVCAVRRVDSHWFTACGNVLKGLQVEDFCAQGLITCGCCSGRWSSD